ncbi:MAG: T9SS type A sorting domain-containing protein [Psychroflexus sp.]|nr:T9SS type A sorting domain-containing protein [Psychroflexus sp.]
MIKQLSILICFFSISISFAQLSITDIQGNPYQDGDVYNYDTNVFEDAKLKYVISNTSNTDDINVLIEVVSFSNTDGTSCQLCVQPLCFFSINEGQSYPNNPITLSPGTNNGPADYFSNTNPGDGANYPIEYVLRFYTVDDSGNEIGNDITLTYRYTPETFSTSNFSLKDLGIVLHNTTVSETLNLDTNKKISLKLYSLNAKQIGVFDVNSGKHQINMSDLSSGHYIVIFEDNTGRQSHVRIQKQ